MQGPRLYRFFNYEMPVYLPAPVGGWNPDANPWELPITEATQLDNFLIRPGKIVMRGPLVVSADLSTWYPLNLAGAAIGAHAAVLSRKNAAAAGQVDHWNVPLLLPSSVQLASGLTTGVYISGGATAYTFASADTIVGPRWINFYGQIYGLSYDCVAAPVHDANATYSVKPINLLTTTLPSSLAPTNASTTYFDQVIGGLNENGNWQYADNSYVNQSSASAGSFPMHVNFFSGGAGSVADFLEGHGFGFALGSSSGIQGIEVVITRRCSTSGTAADSQIQLIKNGVGFANYVGQVKYGAGTIPTTDTTVAFGGPTDLWGTTWSYSDINNALFGVAYAPAPVGNTNPGTVTVSSITITVYYTTGSTTISVLSNAPHGAFDLIGYQSRIWMLGGIDTPGAGTTHDPLALFFTNPIAAGGGSATADWQDPVTGLTNKIVMDGDASDFGVALSTVRNGLVILRRGSVYLLRGSTTSNYTLVPISQEIGCVDARSVVETDVGVYFLSHEGLMLTNGTHVTNVSGSATYTLRDAIRAEQHAVLVGGNGYATCARTSGGQILVSIGVGANNGSYTPIFTAMYDPGAGRGGAWVRITSSLWSGDGTQLNGNLYAGQLFDYRAPKQVYAIGDRYLTSFENENSRQTFLDTTSGMYDQLPSGVNPYRAIPAVWQTVVPAITVANKRVLALARRFYVDYNFAAQSLIPTTGWSVQAHKVDGSAFVNDAAVACPVGAVPQAIGWVSGVSPTPTKFILRVNADWNYEIQDVTWTVSWSDVARASQASLTVAEIYGLGVEFQRARDLRTAT